MAWIPVDAGTGSSPCFREKRRPLLVECVVVALDVAQIATRPHNVVPGAAFARQQSRDVVKRPPHLRAKIADVYALALFIDVAVPEISRMVSPFRSIRMPRENELGLAYA